MNCPQCKSEDVIRVAAMYEQGGSAINLSTAGIGLGAGGLGVGVANTGGSSLTWAAQRLGPPRKPKGSQLAGFVLVGGFLGSLAIMSVLAQAQGVTGPGPAIIALLLGLVVTIGFAIAFSSRDGVRHAVAHTAAMEKWQRLWYCRRCAHAADRDAFGAS